MQNSHVIYRATLGAIFSSSSGGCLLKVEGDIYAYGSAYLFTKLDVAKFQEQLLAMPLQIDKNGGDGNIFDDDRISGDHNSDDPESRPTTSYSRKRYLTAARHYPMYLIL